MIPTRNLVLCDIDGVLADAAHREPLIEAEGWDAHHGASGNDQPFQDIVDLVNAMAAAGLHVALLTGRTEKWRHLTMTWLIKHGVELHELIMRPDDDFRPAAVLKLALAQDRFERLQERLLLVLEDHEPTAAAWRSFGTSVALISPRRSA